MKKYYEAYEERYKTAHENGVCWLSGESTPIVLEMLKKYQIDPARRILEIGCGEGRDAKTVLACGYQLLATDISREAIAYCRRSMPLYKDSFAVLDCMEDSHPEKYTFIYAVAVIHMLVLDEDRNRFYRFIRNHLTEDGVALICTMGDGAVEMQSDINHAFDLQERPHPSGTGTIFVAGTSCRKVSFPTFEKEIAANDLLLLEKGLTASVPDFDCLMYAVVRRKTK